MRRDLPVPLMTVLVNRQGSAMTGSILHPLEEPHCLQHEYFQLGIDDLRKGISIAFNGKKWQCFNLIEPAR